MDAFANLFSEDADFVNVRGVRWIGRGEIKKAHAAAHATIFSKSQLSVVGEISVRFLKPDVAVARSITEVKGQVDNAGGTLPPRDALLTLVLVRQDAKWTIVVAQNTNIDPAVLPARPLDRLLVLPVAIDVAPLSSYRFPSARDPMRGAAFGDPGSGYPDVRMTIPLPMTCTPHIAIARRRGVFDAIRRRRRIRDDLGPGTSRLRKDDRAGCQTGRQNQATAERS
jgi:uncharacterized protein (TIGR02246 family)